MSSWAFSRKIAARYLFSKRLEAFITIITLIAVLGISIAVVVINITMAIMTGFEHEFKTKIIGANSHVAVERLGARLDDWAAVQEKIGKVTGVKSSAPYTYNQALLKTNSGFSGILVRGILENSVTSKELQGYLKNEKNIENLFHPLPIEIEAFEGKSNKVELPAIIIGKELAKDLGLFTGSIVTLLSPNVNSTPLGLVNKFKRFQVAAIYNSGLTEYEASWIYMDIHEAQKFFGLGESVKGVEVRVRNFDDAPVVAKSVLEALGGLGSGYIAEDWTQKNKPLWDAIRLEKRVYFIVLMLLVVLASFSIISTLVMVVLEKRKDIAILKTMGASRSSIGHIFHLQGALIGLTGTLLGTLGGYLGCVGLRAYGFPLDERIFQMATVPVQIAGINFFVVALVAFSISFLATLYPARRAASLNPVDILRYE